MYLAWGIVLSNVFVERLTLRYCTSDVFEQFHIKNVTQRSQIFFKVKYPSNQNNHKSKTLFFRLNSPSHLSDDPLNEGTRPWLAQVKYLMRWYKCKPSHNAICCIIISNGAKFKNKLFYFYLYKTLTVALLFTTVVSGTFTLLNDLCTSGADEPHHHVWN